MSAGTTKLGWGILGVAKVNERLLPAFAQAGNAELRAIASRSLDKAQAAAAAAGVPSAYGSYDALLDDPKVDAVYIPLPNHLHAEWTVKAAEGGKHVLCEKPLATNADEACRVVEFCRLKGVRVMDGFMWPHHPRTHRLRQLLDTGGIGQICHVAGAFTFRLDPMDASNIRLRSGPGGGSLLDVGCYPVFGIRWVLGVEPLRVFASAKYQNDVDVDMTGLLEFPGGRTATFDCGFTLPYRGHLEITGSEGIVSVHNMWLPPRRATFEVSREGQPVEEVVVQGEDQIVHMLENFGRAVLQGTPIVPDPEQAVGTLRVLDALARSARQRVPVVVS